MVGMDLVIIGRQVQTSFGGRIDLLALNRDASCVVLELKRGRTPREAVAQILEYAAWIKDLGYNELDKLPKTIEERPGHGFRGYFRDGSSKSSQC